VILWSHSRMDRRLTILYQLHRLSWEEEHARSNIKDEYSCFKVLSIAFAWNDWRKLWKPRSGQPVPECKSTLPLCYHVRCWKLNSFCSCYSNVNCSKVTFGIHYFYFILHVILIFYEKTDDAAPAWMVNGKHAMKQWELEIKDHAVSLTYSLTRQGSN
jgi:hypothetical protein